MDFFSYYIYSLTCISKKLVIIVNNYSGYRVVKTIATIIATFWNLSRWNTICKLGSPYRETERALLEEGNFLFQTLHVHLTIVTMKYLLA